MPVNDLYSTSEAAALLGLAPGSVRNAIAHGALKAVQIAGRNLVTGDEIERYRKEVQGTHGWELRKSPDYTPNERQRVYQQAYYARRKAARQEGREE